MKKRISVSFLFLLLITFINGQNLKGYFPFNGNSNDESSSNNNGVVYSATLTTDRFGTPNSAYEFDGINDYIQIPYNYSYSEMTITGWFYPYITPQEGPVIFKFKDLYDDWGLFYRNGAHILNDISNDNQQLYNFSITQNWHFFAIILTNTNENKMYVDNVLVGSGSYSSNNLTSFIGDLYIGQRNSAVGYNYFTGKIDDIGIYDNALSPTEVDSIYTKVTELNEISFIDFYPIPSRNNVYIKLSKINSDTFVQVHDIEGKLITNYSINIDEQRIELNIKNLENGVYFVTLLNNEGLICTRKIVKIE